MAKISEYTNGAPVENTDEFIVARAGQNKKLTWANFVTALNLLYITATQTVTLTNKRVTPRTGTVASSATPTINTDNVDYFSITALAVNITSMSTNLSGTPTANQKLWIAITGTAARTIAWGASFENGGVDLPTTTVLTERLDVGLVWNEITNKWRCVASETG